MPMIADPESTPENPLPRIPMFSTFKELVEWHLKNTLKRLVEQGHDLLQADKDVFDTDFFE